MNNWNKKWKEFWKPLLLTKGKFDEKKIKAEMHDLVFIYEQVAKVYSHITGNTLSKPMYYADTVIGVYEDELNQLVEEGVKEAIAEAKEAKDDIILAEADDQREDRQLDD